MNKLFINILLIIATIFVFLMIGIISNYIFSGSFQIYEVLFQTALYFGAGVIWLGIIKGWSFITKKGKN
jgi:hypothetical protein